MCFSLHFLHSVSRDLYSNVTRSGSPYKATPPKSRKTTPTSPFGPNPVVPGGTIWLSFVLIRLFQISTVVMNIKRFSWITSRNLIDKKESIFLSLELRWIGLSSQCNIFHHWFLSRSKSDLTSHSCAIAFVEKGAWAGFLIPAHLLKQSLFIEYSQLGKWNTLEDLLILHIQIAL